MPGSTDILPRSFRDGDELTAGLIDAILQELWRWKGLDVSAPLGMDRGDANGPPTLYLAQALNLVPALTTSAIASGGSYTSPTSGTADFLNWDPVGDSFSDSGQSVTVWNPYAAGISSGTFIWIAFYLTDWFLVTADCP